VSENKKRTYKEESDSSVSVSILNGRRETAVRAFSFFGLEIPETISYGNEIKSL